MKEGNILLLSAGRRAELLRGIETAAARHFKKALVVCADINPQMSPACQLAQRSFSLPHVHSDEYEEALFELCEKLEIGLIIPTIDTELLKLAKLRERAMKRDVAVIISNETLIQQCRDKRLTANLFASLGIEAPVVYDLENIVFPCFTKPASGSSGIGAFRLESPDQLTSALGEEKDRMFMELVPDGLREITIDLYYDRNSVLQAAVPRERLEIRSGEVSKGITRRDWVYDYLVERMSFLEGAIGCLTLQLFADDSTQQVHAIEINPRFGGGFPLALAAGADFPDWLIREYFLGEEITFFDGWERDLLMLRYDAKVLVHRDG